MKKIAKAMSLCLSASLLTVINPNVAHAANLENDTAVAGISVALNNYYATSLSPELDILEFLKPLVGENVQFLALSVFYNSCKNLHCFCFTACVNFVFVGSQNNFKFNSGINFGVQKFRFKNKSFGNFVLFSARLNNCVHVLNLPYQSLAKQR